MTEYEGNPTITRIELEMPRLIGNQKQVEHLFNVQEIPKDLTGETVYLLARALHFSPSLVADEIIRLLQVRNAERVLIYGSPEDFTEVLFEAAERRGYNGLSEGTEEELRLP